MTYNLQDVLQKVSTLHNKPIDLSLKRLYSLLEKLQNPHKKVKNIIHVAGTNGKGSSAKMLLSILKDANYSCAGYFSPHLLNFTERIVINNQNICVHLLTDLLNYVYKVNKDSDITYFEFITATAFVAFAEHHHDALILEVGLGGEFDATNICETSLACLLTPIDRDHKEYLSDDITLIAKTKAAIIKPNSLVVTADSPYPDVLSVITDKCQQHRNKLLIENVNFSITDTKSKTFVYQADGVIEEYPHPALPGKHQLQNASLAIATLKNLSQQNILTLSHENYSQGLTSTIHQGRLQTIKQGPIYHTLKPRSIWLDCAHNKHAAIVLNNFMQEYSSGRTWIFISSLLKTKDICQFYTPFLTSVKVVILPTLTQKERFHDNRNISDFFTQHNVKTLLADNLSQCFSLAKQYSLEKDVVMISGSIYFAEEVLNYNDDNSSND